MWFLTDYRLGEDGEEHALDADDLASMDPSPEEQVLRKMAWEEVLAETAKMPVLRQAIFHDRYEAGLTARETAERLHMSLGTVQWHDREIIIALKPHFGQPDTGASELGSSRTPTGPARLGLTTSAPRGQRSKRNQSDDCRQKVPCFGTDPGLS